MEQAAVHDQCNPHRALAGWNQLFHNSGECSSGSGRALHRRCSAQGRMCFCTTRPASTAAEQQSNSATIADGRVDGGGGVHQENTRVDRIGPVRCTNHTLCSAVYESSGHRPPVETAADISRQLIGLDRNSAKNIQTKLQFCRQLGGRSAQLT